METAMENRMFLLFRSPLPRMPVRTATSDYDHEPIVTEYYDALAQSVSASLTDFFVTDTM